MSYLEGGHWTYQGNLNLNSQQNLGMTYRISLEYKCWCGECTVGREEAEWLTMKTQQKLIVALIWWKHHRVENGLPKYGYISKIHFSPTQVKSILAQHM